MVNREVEDWDVTVLDRGVEVDELAGALALEDIVLVVVIIEESLVDVGGIRVAIEIAAEEVVVGTGGATDVVVGTGAEGGLGAQSAKGSWPSQP